MSTENNKIIMKTIHGMSMSSTRFFAFRFNFNPTELISLRKVDFPDIIQAKTKSKDKLLFSCMIYSSKYIHFFINKCCCMSKSSSWLLPYHFYLLHPSHVLYIQHRNCFIVTLIFEIWRAVVTSKKYH